MNYIVKRINAFRQATSGIITAVKEEAHLKVHLFASLVVVGMASYFNVTTIEWCVLILCCVSVISLELVNSAMERLTNAVYPHQHLNAKFIKDVTAGAVLIAALGSLISGLLIFWKYFVI